MKCMSRSGCSVCLSSFELLLYWTWMSPVWMLAASLAHIRPRVAPTKDARKRHKGERNQKLLSSEATAVSDGGGSAGSAVCSLYVRIWSSICLFCSDQSDLCANSLLNYCCEVLNLEMSSVVIWRDQKSDYCILTVYSCKTTKIENSFHSIWNRYMFFTEQVLLLRGDCANH